MLGLHIILNLAVFVASFWLVLKVKGVVGIALRAVLAVAGVVFGFYYSDIFTAALAVSSLTICAHEWAQMRKQRQELNWISTEISAQPLHPRQKS